MKIISISLVFTLQSIIWTTMATWEKSIPIIWSLGHDDTEGNNDYSNLQIELGLESLCAAVLMDTLFMSHVSCTLDDLTSVANSLGNICTADSVNAETEALDFDSSEGRQRRHHQEQRQKQRHESTRQGLHGEGGRQKRTWSSKRDSTNTNEERFSTSRLTAVLTDSDKVAQMASINSDDVDTLQKQIFHSAKFERCNFNSDSGVIQLQFKPLPNLSSTHHILHAHPFTLYLPHTADREFSPVEFVGPHIVAYSRKNHEVLDCSPPLHEMTGSDSLLHIPVNDYICRPLTRVAHRNIWKQRCDFMHKMNYTSMDTIQVKKVGDLVFIYCFGFSIRLQDVIEECPSFVISVKSSDDYEFLASIGTEHELDGGQNITVQQFNNSLDLEFTKRINSHFVFEDVNPENLDTNGCSHNFEMSDDSEEIFPTPSLDPDLNDFGNETGNGTRKAIPITVGVAGSSVGVAGAAGIFQAVRKVRSKNNEEKSDKPTTKKKSKPKPKAKSKGADGEELEDVPEGEDAGDSEADEKAALIDTTTNDEPSTSLQCAGRVNMDMTIAQRLTEFRDQLVAFMDRYSKYLPKVKLPFRIRKREPYCHNYHVL